MKINITNGTKYDQIKFYMYYIHDVDGIDKSDKLWTDFYQVSNKDTIEFDLKIISIITLKIFIKHNDSGYCFKYNYLYFGNVLDLKLKDGENYPILKINNIKPKKRDEWQEPINTCFIL